MRVRFGKVTRHGLYDLRDLLMPIIFFVLIVVCVAWGVGNLDRTVTEEQLKSVETAVTRAMVQCYALEGQYPPSVDYLKEHYGLSVDESKYAIHYEIFASNIMPQITVIALNP